MPPWHGFFVRYAGNNILHGLKLNGMNDQSNKHQQPPQGNKQDKGMNQQGQKPGKEDQSKHQGQQQKRPVQNQNDMDEPDQPDQRNKIGDNPDETKKKIPNMEKDR